MCGSFQSWCFCVCVLVMSVCAGGGQTLKKRGSLGSGVGGVDNGVEGWVH